MYASNFLYINAYAYIFFQYFGNEMGIAICVCVYVYTHICIATNIKLALYRPLTHA